MPHILLGRRQVATLFPPQFRFGSDIEDSRVTNAQGEDLGEIEDLVIDRQTGRIAYVLVSEDEFLGIGEEVRPVPMAALRHLPESNTYRLAISDDDLEKTRTISRDGTPSSVRRADLVELFEQFDVDPYWQTEQSR